MECCWKIFQQVLYLKFKRKFYFWFYVRKMSNFHLKTGEIISFFFKLKYYFRVIKKHNIEHFQNFKKIPDLNIKNFFVKEIVLGCYFDVTVFLEFSARLAYKAAENLFHS